MDNNAHTQTGLVLEGGGMRGMFTCGVLDAFMTCNIEFDALVGVSAGALFGSNFKSKQYGRALRYNLKFINNSNYIGWKSFIKTGNYVNVDFSYNLIPNIYDPFYYKVFKENKMKFYAVCTDLTKGVPKYELIEDIKHEGMNWMRASASMPIFAKPVKIAENFYLDGGIVDSIPLKFIQKEGYKRNIVILTQPVNYNKNKCHLGPLFKVCLPKFPCVSKLMSIRHEMYNEQLDYIKSEEKKGNTLIIAPDEPLNIGRLCLNEKKIVEVYNKGVEKAIELLPKIRSFLNELK